MPAETIFYYRKLGQNSLFPGAHMSRVAGSGQLFKQHQSLINMPDPRHIDLRASLLDPFSRFQVKTFQQLSRLDVFLLADLSASMRFVGAYDKRQALVDCLLSVAQSAHAMHDRFGFVGWGQGIDASFLMAPASLQQGRVSAMAEQLLSTRLTGQGDNILHVHRYLPQHSALVFLLSDFHMSLDKIKQQMQGLSAHTVVPLVLWDNIEQGNLPAWGLVKFSDMEQGQTRTLFMRPKLRQKIKQAFAQRRQQLQQCFRTFGCEPLFIEQGYRAELLSQYFLQHGSRYAL